jgi:prevent-host-death family protein
MKKREKPTTYQISGEGTAPEVLKDAVAMPGMGLTFPVRVAKAKLSALLELVAGGQEIVITSDGEPKAVLVGTSKRSQRRVFSGTIERLRELPIQTTGPFAEEIIRADRDGRGW